MGIFDKQGNPIGDGRHHVKEHVYEFNEYPQISAKVTKSLTTETTYVKYYNSENGKSITVRFSNHVNNAVLFGDQLNGYTAKRDEILFYLGLKKRTLIPNTRLHIWTQSVAKKKLNDYEYTDKTIRDLYELGEGADISKHKGKIAKGSNYLILGDSVEKVIDKKINSLGQKVVLGEYVYSDISVSDEKFKRGGEITPDVCVNYIKKTESILRNGYYSDHGLFYLITYNSGGGKGLNVYQTVNYDVIDRLAFFLGFSDTTAGVILLKHYEDARRFDSLDVLKEIKNKPVIIVDRDTIVCSDYDRKTAKYKMKKNDCIEYVKNNESILKNGYYHEFDGIILLTYNSGGKDNLPVHQTVNMHLADKLSELLKIDQYSAFRIMENHSEKAKRFHDIKDANVFHGKKVIIADRDRIVCHDIIKEFKEGGEVTNNKETKMDSKIFIPSNLIEEIKKSINLGYDNLQEGMISKNRKGVMLVNDNYEVRGTYDVLLKSAINKMILEHKSDQLSKGTKVELEHKDTIEEISSGKLSPEEGAKEIAKDHIDEDPQYYDKLEKVESKTPIKELGTGSKVYFETPFYRVNEYSGSNLNDRFIFTMKAKDDQYGVPLFEHFFDDIDIALFVAEKISKIYPNGVPEAALIHRIIKDISGEYKEKQENNMNSTNNELTGVKSIIVNESRLFSNWNEANESTKWLISQQVWSNLPYKIEFQDGFILEGTIDAEPYSFWKDKKNPLTWHLNTFWGNLARATANPIYDQESIDYAKKVVTKYNIGQDISTDVDNSDVTPPESEDAEVVSSAKQDVIKKLLKEKKTAYNFVYDRLLKVAPDLLRLLNEAEYTSDVYGKSQYRTQDFGGNDAFMYLAIEGLDKDEQGRYELSISHYYKQHGDMMCDPCMTVRLDPELKTVEALTFKMDGVIGRGIIKSVYGTTKDGKPGVNLYEKKDQNSFLNKWSSNWVKQGHKVEFRSLPEKESTTISAEAQAIIQPEWDKMQDFLAGKEAKASDRKNENEIKREKYPIVVEWSEGSTDENIGFENLEQLEIWLEQIGFTETPDETYIKNKVWFRGMTSYVRIDLSRKDGDFNPQEKSLIEYLIENVSKSFDWQSLSEAKTTIVQDDNFTYFKGIQANYENQFKLNKAIEEFLDSRPDDYVYSNEEKEFIITYEGYGGLEKQGATGIGLLFEYYTPLKLIEKMWGLAYKYGFNTGKVLEPSVGVGRFLNYTGKTDVVKGYEINPYSAKICRIIHPKANIILSSFAEHFYKGNVFNPKFEKDFDLVIGNPPYGKMTDLRTHGENSRIGVSISQYEHYFILRGLDCLKSGGLLIYVSTANLATKGYEKIKEKIFEKADLVDCYLLPNTTFKQTKVNTSLIVLRRK